MKWIFRHKKKLIFLGVAISLIVVMSVSFVNNEDNFSGDNKVGNVIIKVQEGIINGTTAIKDNIVGIFRYKKVLRNNEMLLAEILEMKKEMNEIQLQKNDFEELKGLKIALNYIAEKNIKTYATGDVIAKDSTNWFNIFTINIGAKQGVEKDATVLDSNGLVGRVLEVGDTWSKVISITDDRNSVSFQVSRNHTILGVASGFGENKLTGYTLDPKADIIIGDELTTSKLGLYVEEIPIGIVSEIKEDENTLLKTITIEPYSYFLHLDKVLVVNSK